MVIKYLLAALAILAMWKQGELKSKNIVLKTFCLHIYLDMQLGNFLFLWVGLARHYVVPVYFSNKLDTTSLLVSFSFSPEGDATGRKGLFIDRFFHN